MKPPFSAGYWEQGRLSLTFQRQCLGSRISNLRVLTGAEVAGVVLSLSWMGHSLPRPPLCPGLLCVHSQRSAPALEASWVVKGRAGILKVTMAILSSSIAASLVPHGGDADLHLPKTPFGPVMSNCARD